MALVALATAGLVGGGIVVAGQLASADEPTLRTADDEPTTVESDDEARATDDGADDSSVEPGSGEVVIDLGDIGDVARCLGLSFGDGEGPFGPRRGRLFDEDFEQRMEEFLDGLPWDELGDLPGELGGDLGAMGDDGVRIFGSGGSTITIVGPDGLQVIDLGDGDASVTIEQQDGELTVTTEGDASEVDLPDLGELLPRRGEHRDLGDLPDLGELFPLDPEHLPDLDRVLPFDRDQLESCLDEADQSDSTGGEADQG